MDFYETIKDIQYHVTNNISLYKKHDDFKKKYPKLFSMLCDTTCDQSMLQNLISLYKKMNKNTITKEDADVEFGTVAAEKYVKPFINNSTQTEDKEPDWTHV